MKIIDAHLHFSDREGFKKTAKEVAEVPYTAEWLRNEYKSVNVVAGIVMTSPGHFSVNCSFILRHIDMTKWPKIPVILLFNSI